MAFARTGALGTGFGRLGVKKRAGAGAPAGGAALLEGETAGFATDFTYATDASRVAVKVASVNTNYALDAFYSNAGTSPKMVYLAEPTTSNLLTYSSNFENAAWLAFQLTVTANATAAPNGATEADKLAGTGASQYMYVSTTPTAEARTFSIYAKAGEISGIFIEDYEGVKADYFNLTNGTTAPTIGYASSGGAAIQSVGSGWYRCSIWLSAVCASPTIYLAEGNADYLNDINIPAGQGAYLWGAQINYGTTPTTYVPTTAAAAGGGWLGWSPHNMFLNSAAPVTQSVTVITGQIYTVTIVGSGSMTGSSGASGVATAGSPLTFTATGTTPSFTKAGTVTQIQMNRGPVATAYLATTAAQRFGLAVDYNPVTHAARGLLGEPAGTNLAVRSNELNFWTTGGMTVAQNATGPLGVNTAWTLTCNAGATGKWTYIDRIGGTAPFRHSIYAKAGTLSWISMGDASAAAAHAAYFNVSAGTVGTVAGRFSAGAIEPVGNGWFRCSATVAAGSGFFDVQPHSADNQAYTWTAAGGETVFVSAAQAESGTVATSYIPTSSATVTRAADNYRVTSASINHSSTAGSWYAEIYANSSTAGGRVIGYDSGATLASPFLQWDGTPKFSVFDGTVTVDQTVGAAIGAHKLACAFQASDKAISADGQAIATSTSAATGLITGVTIIGFGVIPSSGSNWNGYIKKVRYVPRRKTNPELVTETTP